MSRRAFWPIIPTRFTATCMTFASIWRTSFVRANCVIFLRIDCALWKSQLTNGDRAALRLPLAPAPQATMTSTQAVSFAEEHLFDRHSIVHEHELWRYALEFARGSTLTLADIKRETSARDYMRERGGRRRSRWESHRPSWHTQTEAQTGS